MGQIVLDDINGSNSATSWGMPGGTDNPIFKAIRSKIFTEERLAIENENAILYEYFDFTQEPRLVMCVSAYSTSRAWSSFPSYITEDRTISTSSAIAYQNRNTEGGYKWITPSKENTILYMGEIVKEISDFPSNRLTHWTAVPDAENFVAQFNNQYYNVTQPALGEKLNLDDLSEYYYIGHQAGYSIRPSFSYFTGTAGSRSKSYSNILLSVPFGHLVNRINGDDITDNRMKYFFSLEQCIGNTQDSAYLIASIRRALILYNAITEEDWIYATRNSHPTGYLLSFGEANNYIGSFIRKETFKKIMNWIGIPWTLSLEEAQNSSIEDLTDYDPNPDIPTDAGQENNTTGDWTGAGDNSEDSFEFTTPNFSPFGSTVNQYAMSGLQVQQFIRELFEGSFITNPDLIKNDPKEGLVSCRYYPFNVRFHDPEGIGNQEDIVVGGVQMEYSAGAKILPNYNQILDIGEFKVDEYFGGFLDYQLTTIDIYLPYIGWQQLPATSLMGRTLKIKYVVDIISGDCSCILTTTDGEIERLENMFSGHMGIDIPILTSNHNENTKQAASSVLSAVTAVGGAVATYATGGIGGIAAAGISATAITNSATDIATMQNHANMGTPISSSTSLWMPQDIIFRITRPRKSEASEFKNRRGYRSNYSTQLKNVTGFVQIDDPFLDGLSLHEGEKEQLAQILKGGIFI